MRGILITLEGEEGAGKTCHIPYLKETLTKYGFKVIVTREPGGTSIGEQVRQILESDENSEMNIRTETLLFQAARAQMVDEIIKPNIERDNVVILMDRFFDSTTAYQGYAREQDLGQIASLVKYATEGLVPDLTVLFDVDVEVGLSRKKGSQEWNRMDALSKEFHQKAREGYLEIAQKNPDRFIVIDANNDIETVRQELISKVVERLISHGFIEREKINIER